MHKITIYSTPTCVYCKMAEAYFKEHHVEYTKKDVSEDDEARRDMAQKSGQLGVPVIDIDGKIVIGFNKAKLAELLAIS